jgi:hypothetical protein
VASDYGDAPGSGARGQRFEAFEVSLFVRPHQPRVTRHIGGEDRGKAAFDGLLHGLPSVTAIIAERRPPARWNERCPLPSPYDVRTVTQTAG